MRKETKETLKIGDKVVNQDGMRGVVATHGAYSDYPFQVKSKDGEYHLIDDDGTEPYSHGTRYWRKR